jgi:hypothetical protein
MSAGALRTVPVFFPERGPRKRKERLTGHSREGESKNNGEERQPSLSEPHVECSTARRADGEKETERQTRHLVRQHQQEGLDATVM